MVPGTSSIKNWNTKFRRGEISTLEDDRSRRPRKGYRRYTYSFDSKYSSIDYYFPVIVKLLYSEWYNIVK